MIPSQLVIVESFPLTQNGKVDVKTLQKSAKANVDLVKSQAPNKAAVSKSYDALETEILNIFESVIQEEGLSVHDKFFDLGVSSISLVQIQRLIRNKFNVEISVLDLFSYTTISEITRHLNEKYSVSDRKPEDTDKTDAIKSTELASKRKRRTRQRHEEIVN